MHVAFLTSIDQLARWTAAGGLCSMAQWRLTLTLTALCVFVWRVWASLEVSMKDREEVLLEEKANIVCAYNLPELTSSLTIQWFVRAPGVSNKEQIYYKDSSSEFEVQGTKFTGRINVSHSLEATKGNSILTINNTRLSDELEFFCQVSVDGISKEGRTQLLVFNAPTRPTIKVEPYVSVGTQQPGKIASCEVRNAYPAPNITWYKDTTPLQHSDSKVRVKTIRTFNPSGLFTVESKLELEVEKKDKDAEFYCEINYFTPRTQGMMESDHVNITVHYPSTEATMKQESPKGLIKEGDRVEISCQGNGNPQPFITFTYNDEDWQPENNLLVLVSVTRRNSGTYSCSALDLVEVISANLSITVHYLDSVVIIPEEEVHLGEGDDLSLTCYANSSLYTHAVWYKDNAYLTEGHMLNLHNASYDMAGKYVCVIEASDLPELRRNNSVLITVKGKPVITEGVKVIPLDSEKSVNLSCTATGHPAPTIIWALSDEQARVSEWITKKEDKVISVISISTSSYITASCEASNKMGTVKESRKIEATEFKKPTTSITSTTSTSTKAPETTNTSKRVRKEGSGVIIAVIIILILLLAILGSVLYFLYKKGKIPCGRSGKQDLTKESASKDDIVVEMKSGKSEEAVLLQGVNGEKKFPNDQ
ncbi:melanoma cell adhesion molecule b isoform X1 [Pygocentrus nattereri]|uniref:Ig-like domain-containing protein n=1 Tax=Pygocentrus nattereri TaxID=42514 RepID=A0A3B4D6B0_PYGNA|nr:melanoma cell adhesion molecule b isoform X1 [Pygocentrus nattereri]